MGTTTIQHSEDRQPFFFWRLVLIVNLIALFNYTMDARVSLLVLINWLRKFSYLIFFTCYHISQNTQ